MVTGIVSFIKNSTRSTVKVELCEDFIIAKIYATEEFGILGACIAFIPRLARLSISTWTKLIDSFSSVFRMSVEVTKEPCKELNNAPLNIPATPNI